MFDATIIFNTLLYSVWCFYFCRQILKQRFSPLRTYLFILTVHVFLVFGGRTLFPDRHPFVLVNLATVCSVFAGHCGTVKKKFMTYVLYNTIIILMEMLLMSLYVCVQNLFFHRQASLVAMASVQSASDFAILCAIMLTAGSIMFKIFADLAGKFSQFYSIIPLAQVFFPFFCYFITFSAIYTYDLKFGIGVLLLFCSVLATPVFYLGIRNIRIHEKNRILRENQISLLRDQLEFFDNFDLEYQELRKWNHDIENHLLSMSYLMKNSKYNEAKKYLDNISR